MDEAELLCYAAIALLAKKKRKKRSMWTKEWLQKRNHYSHTNLLEELRLFPRDWFNYLRMTEVVYLNLLKLVTPMIEKRSTNMRESISPHERLSATLRFLATGRNYEDLKYSTLISPQALGRIIPETCAAILDALKDYYKFPQDEQDWLDIARGFEQRWNFPHCLGATDGKHVAIKPPPGAGSYFRNYKGFDSQVLLGIANSNYEFIYFSYGINGRVSDGGVFQYSDIYRKLHEKTLKLPNPSEVNGCVLPYVFIGDEAFSLTPEFMKPFRQNLLNVERRVYNYRLSRARRIIENVFGILVNRFKVLESKIIVDIENNKPIVLACCALHNYLRRVTPSTYSPPESYGVEDISTGEITTGLQTRDDMSLQHNRRGNINQTASHIRNLFVDYFNNAGQVPWQERFI
ncbi:unnamed protein product [Euphydryas editha]|uniref:DDE Tnp4 domain-containing protein n=1 Tax=Euphydryas editha TaxID=104508 RepID=A0AAU9TEF0_EUPED|nr:unnamed protein product [Euphydryas editha]